MSNTIENPFIIFCKLRRIPKDEENPLEDLVNRRVTDTLRITETKEDIPPLTQSELELLERLDLDQTSLDDLTRLCICGLNNTPELLALY